MISLNPAHQDLSSNTKGAFQFLQNFQLQFNLIYIKEIIQYSRTFALQVQTSWNQAHAPLLFESFPKTRSGDNLKQAGLVDLIITKQNKKITNFSIYFLLKSHPFFCFFGFKKKIN